MSRDSYIQSISQFYRPELARIDPEAIAGLQISRDEASLAGTSFPFGPVAPPPPGGPRFGDAWAAMQYLVAQTALQYRFWDFQCGVFQRYQFDGAVGSTGMMRAFDRAWGTELEPAPALVAAARGVEGVRAVFGDIPDPESRQRILAESLLGAASGLLCDTLLTRILREGKVTVDHARLIARTLPQAYGDPFLKKAMLVLGLIATWLRESYEIADELAAYADYQVPSVLRHHGVLRYSSALALSVDNRQPLAKGAESECAIRSATVLACEAIAQHFGVTSAEVDWWCFCQRKLPVRPFHLTYTTDY